MRSLWLTDIHAACHTIPDGLHDCQRQRDGHSAAANPMHADKLFLICMFAVCNAVHLRCQCHTECNMNFTKTSTYQRVSGSILSSFCLRVTSNPLQWLLRQCVSVYVCRLALCIEAPAISVWMCVWMGECWLVLCCTLSGKKTREAPHKCSPFTITVFTGWIVLLNSNSINFIGMTIVKNTVLPDHCINKCWQKMSKCIHFSMYMYMYETLAAQVNKQTKKGN